MPNFDAVWRILTQRAQEHEYVETLSRQNKNDVEYNEASNSIRFNSRASEKDHWKDVKHDDWEKAWNELLRTGELSQQDFIDVTNVWRSSAAVAFLQHALDLPTDAARTQIELPSEFSIAEHLKSLNASTTQTALESFRVGVEYRNKGMQYKTADEDEFLSRLIPTDDFGLSPLKGMKFLETHGPTSEVG